MKTAKELLIEICGDKESYEKHETLTAMIEYAIQKTEEQHKAHMETIKEVFASSPNNAK